MLIHLIRHAHAGSRKGWSGEDNKRPLSDRGLAQSEAIAAALAEAGVDRLWSSSFVRCVQTLEPLGRRLGISVYPFAELAEGGSGRKALDALLEAAAAGHTVAASSHGDVIPAIIDAAMQAGATLDGPSSPRKGARYELTVEGTEVTHIHHIDPPPTN